MVKLYCRQITTLRRYTEFILSKWWFASFYVYSYDRLPILFIQVSFATLCHLIPNSAVSSGGNFCIARVLEQHIIERRKCHFFLQYINGGTEFNKNQLVLHRNMLIDMMRRKKFKNGKENFKNQTLYPQSVGEVVEFLKKEPAAREMLPEAVNPYFAYRACTDM